MRLVPSPLFKTLLRQRRLPGNTFHWAILLFVSFAGIFSSEARLGETPKKCAKLYGAPLGKISVPGLIPNGIEFHRGEYSITCGFEEERCVVVVILRLSPQNPTEKSIPREDITLFMRDNFGSTSWTYTQLDQFGKLWKTNDPANLRSYRATYASSLHMLTLQIEPL